MAASFLKNLKQTKSYSKPTLEKGRKKGSIKLILFDIKAIKLFSQLHAIIQTFDNHKMLSNLIVSIKLLRFQIVQHFLLLMP